MRKILVVLLFFPLGMSIGYGAEPKYPVSGIPEELKKDVDVVIREDHMTFSIISQSKAAMTVQLVATIFNVNGKGYALCNVGYDKLRKINSFKASTYDAEGNLIKRVKNNEILDESAFDGLYSDDRTKSVDLRQSTYPYTVEFEYEIEFKFLFYIPGSVFGSEKVSVQNASYTLQYPEDLKPRFKATNISAEPVVSKLPNGSHQTRWSMKNLMPVKFEALSPSAETLLPRISAAPTRFEYDGYVGTMDTWENYGKWMASLNKGRNNLPEATKIKARELTANLKTTEEKTRVLYQYLQNKTRYVSIQLGIGGHQPFEASVVDQTGYGDCKALSNYMISLLDAVGIKANYVLILAGDDASPLDTKFPSSQFNHVIAAVPNGTDTLWLECTSQTTPFGYMGTFTGDRKALMITNDGAKVVKTIYYSADQNTQIRKAQVALQANGDATAKVKTVYSGIQYENGHLNFLLERQYDDQKKWLQKTTDIPSFDVSTFSMSVQKSIIPSATVKVDYTLKRFATVSGKRFFITPNLMNRSTFVPEKLESRKTNVMVSMAFTDIDTVQYDLPEGIYPEFIPAPITLKSRFGEYDAQFILDQNRLIYVRKKKMNKGEYPADSYNELIGFFRGISKADNTKMVFLSKT